VLPRREPNKPRRRDNGLPGGGGERFVLVSKKSLSCVKVRMVRAEDQKVILTYLPTPVLFMGCLATIGREATS
jgi:hypothetical protein